MLKLTSKVIKEALEEDLKEFSEEMKKTVTNEVNNFLLFITNFLCEKEEEKAKDGD